VFLFSWIITSLQECLETVCKSLFPEELFILILANELVGSILNLEEVVGELLHGSVDNVMILDLNKVITYSSIKSWNLNSKRNEIINDSLKDVFETVFFTVAANTWIKDNFSVDQVNSDVKDWWIAMMSIVWNIDLVRQEAHGFGDTNSYTLNDKRVNVRLII
jgi:hypothetical protein